VDTGRKEEGTGGGVIELSAIVALDSLDGEAELSGYPSKEVAKSGESLGLGTQRKSPGIMGEIIDHHQVVLIARHAENRRGPQVAVNKIKCTRGMRG
jgi:hypothetical protein